MSRAREGVEGLSDEALLRGLAFGDPDIGVAFVRRFQRRVYGVAASLIDDPVLAEDIAQEAFLRAWKHAGAFDPRRASVATWLLSITRHLAIDALRLRRASPTDPADLLRLAGRSDTRGPEDRALASVAGARLRAAIFALPDEQRRALVLASFYGRTAQEIAAAEGIPLGTAKTRVRSAMGKLRSAMAEERGLA